jgi:hypothetical protein
MMNAFNNLIDAIESGEIMIIDDKDKSFADRRGINMKGIVPVEDMKKKFLDPATKPNPTAKLIGDYEWDPWQLIEGEPEGKKEKAVWYDMMLAEIDAGRDPEEVAKEYGATVSKINRARGQRERSRKKKSATILAHVTESAKANENAPDKEVSENPTKIIDKTPSVDMYKDSITKHQRENVVNEAFARSLTVLETVSSKDGMRPKAAALMMVREIIDQASERITEAVS